MQWTVGILRHFRAFSTPEQNPALGVLSTPAPPSLTQAVEQLVVVASYYLLPEGVLRRKPPLISSFELSSDLLTSTLQIFGYNLIPIGLIIAANLIARQSRIAEEKFVPVGYTACWVITLLFALYIGTWSFEVVTAAPPIQDRLLRVFDILHRAGLLEFSAYILAAVTSYKLTLWYSDGKKVIRSRRPNDVKLDRTEKVVLVLVPCQG